MSPFRIVGIDADNKKYVLAAMLSTNKETGARKVYILHKPTPELLDNTESQISERDLAYAMSTKTNSTIVGTYIVNRTDHRTYELQRVRRSLGNNHLINITEHVSDDNKTLFECQKRAMEDYCVLNRFDIINIL